MSIAKHHKSHTASYYCQYCGEKGELVSKYMKMIEYFVCINNTCDMFKEKQPSFNVRYL